MTFFRFPTLVSFPLTCAMALFASLPAQAVDYGIYDARSMGMGGASVAAGNADHAHFYNPALLSREDKDEDLSRNGRFVFPSVAGFVSDAGQAAVDIASDDLEQRISDSVERFNTQVDSAAAASEVLGALRDFDRAITDINGKNAEFDVAAGVSISEPADREGGSFYFSLRGLAFGRAEITDEDLATMDTYINAMSQIAAGTATIADFNGVVANNGQLIDPRPTLTSEAALSTLLIGEWGIALSKEFSIYGWPVAFGITPKIMQVEVYREDITFADEEVLSYDENKRSHLAMNADFGVAMEFLDYFRVGIATRDIMEKTLKSQNGERLTMKPRTRMGLAMDYEWLTVGLDVDLQKNTPLANEEESQELALGLEVRPWDSVHLRFGYQQDFVAKERADVLSAGIRYQIWRFLIEGAYATSDDTEGGALQLAWMF